MPTEDQADAAKRKVLTLLAELEAEGCTFGGHWSGALIINAQGCYAGVEYLGDDGEHFGTAAAELAAMGPAPDAVLPDRTDLGDGRCTNHPSTCMIPGCDHAAEPQRSRDIAKWGATSVAGWGADAEG